MGNESRCMVVMYHYVRDSSETDFPEIKALETDKFRRQLDYLEKNYSVIGLGDYSEFLNGDSKIPADSCILSFDDGLKDHYTNVFPELKRRGLTACFFPMTEPLEEQVVPAVQKLQFLLAKIGKDALVREYNKALKDEFPGLAERFSVTGNMKKEKEYRWDDQLTSELKCRIGAMPVKEKKKVMDIIFSRHFKEEKEFCSGLYLNWEEIKEMLEEDMEIGGHTKTHPWLSELSEDEQRKELEESKNVLEKNLGIRINLFSYPYGKFNSTTVELLKETGYSCSLTTETAVNEGKVNPFKISRFDTNDVSFG